MVQESPRESLFKDRYFVSGIDAGIGSGIAKRSSSDEYFQGGDESSKMAFDALFQSPDDAVPPDVEVEVEAE